MNGVPWSPTEMDRLCRLCGDLPPPLLIESFQQWAATHGFPHRTARAIWRKAEVLGLSRQTVGDWLTPYDVALILRIHHHRVYRWVRAFPGILQPFRPYQGPGGKTYIRRDRILAFARRRPDQFGGLDADSLFLLLESRSMASRIAEAYPNRPGGAPTPVRNCDTGRVFPTKTDAARAMNVSRFAIARAVTTGGRCAGFRWADAQEVA